MAIVDSPSLRRLASRVSSAPRMLRLVAARAAARFPALVPILVLLLAAGACVDLEQVLRVRTDGGGELLVNVRFDPKLLQESVDGGEAASVEEMLAEMKQRAAADAGSQAAELGEGVRFAGVEELPGDRPGLQLRFDFDDVNALRLSPMGPLGGQAGGGASEGESADPIAFELERKRKSSTLRAALFSEEELAELAREMEKASSAPPPAADAGGVEQAVDEMAKAMADMMKSMLEGLKVAFVVEPIGEIASTNSSYRDGNRITLFRLDFSALLENEEALQRLGAEQGEPSLASLRRMLGEVPGMEMDLVPEVVVEFSDR